MDKKPKPPMYFLQGFFFQEQQWLDIAFRNVDGAVAVVREGLGRFMFAGIISPRPEQPEMLVGEMNDHFGKSVLVAITIAEETFTFTKCYANRRDHITYTFTRREKFWVGTYAGHLTGMGRSRCILTPAPAELFEH